MIVATGLHAINYFKANSLVLRPFRKIERDLGTRLAGYCDNCILLYQGLLQWH